MMKNNKKENIKKRAIKFNRGWDFFITEFDKLAWGISAFIVIMLLFWLYSCFYVSLNNLSFVTRLKSQVAVKIVDLEMWNKVNDDIEWKKGVIDNIENINNPFE